MRTNMVSSERETDGSVNTVLPDSVSRRYLLFSMLSVAAGSTMLPHPESANAVSGSVTQVEKLSTGSVTAIIKPPLDDRKYEAYTLVSVSVVQ